MAGPASSVKKTRAQRRPRQAGLGLLELMVALVVLAISALALTGSWSVATRAAHDSDQALNAQAALQSVYDSVADVTFDQLLSWDGVTVTRGDHVVTVSATQVGAGLVQLGFVAIESASGRTAGRLATLRSGES